MQSASSSYSQKLEQFISAYWIPFGVLVLLSGLFWLPERSLYSRLYYVLLALPALIAMLAAPRKTVNIIKEPIVLAFLLLAAWVLISLSWSSSDQSGSALAKRPVYILMLFAGCAMVALSQSAAFLSRTLFYGALVTTVAATYSLTIYLYAPPPEQRLIGGGGLINPLLTSHVLGMFCTYWLSRWVCMQQQPLLSAVCGLLLLSAILATGSRTPLLALAFTALWLTLMWRRPKALALLAALVAVGIATLLFLPDMLTQRGFSYRPEIWSESIRQILESPWLGKGYGSPLTIPVSSLQQNFADPHNVELAVALELGGIGLLLWIGLYVAALTPCIRQRTAPEFSIASTLLIYGIVAGMTEGSSFISRPNESWFLIWIPLALVASLNIGKRQEQTCAP